MAIYTNSDSFYADNEIWDTEFDDPKAVAEVTAASVQAAHDAVVTEWECTDHGYPTGKCARTNRHTGHNYQVYRNGSTEYRWCFGY